MISTICYSMIKVKLRTGKVEKLCHVCLIPDKNIEQNETIRCLPLRRVNSQVCRFDVISNHSEPGQAGSSRLSLSGWRWFLQCSIYSALMILGLLSRAIWPTKRVLFSRTLSHRRSQKGRRVPQVPRPEFKPLCSVCALNIMLLQAYCVRNAISRRKNSKIFWRGTGLPVSIRQCTDVGLSGRRMSAHRWPTK